MSSEIPVHLVSKEVFRSIPSDLRRFQILVEIPTDLLQITRWEGVQGLCAVTVELYMKKYPRKGYLPHRHVSRKYPFAPYPSTGAPRRVRLKMQGKRETVLCRIESFCVQKARNPARWVWEVTLKRIPTEQDPHGTQESPL